MIAQLSDIQFAVNSVETDEKVESPVIVMLRRGLYTVTFISGVLFLGDAAYLIAHLMQNKGF